MAKVLRISPTGAARLSDVLKNPAALMKKIGAILVAQGQKAFDEQRFGSIKWPEIYGGGGSPFVNVAGVVGDVSAGGEPKARRFTKKKPALYDTGLLLRSIADEGKACKYTGTHSVEYGSAVEYAPLHQFGGVSEQAVSPAAKATLWRWLKKKKNAKYRGRLGWLLNKRVKVLRTKVQRRPFVGITDDTAEKIRETVEREIVKQSGGE